MSIFVFTACEKNIMVFLFDMVASFILWLIFPQSVPLFPGNLLNKVPTVFEARGDSHEKLD